LWIMNERDVFAPVAIVGLCAVTNGSALEGECTFLVQLKSPFPLTGVHISVLIKIALPPNRSAHSCSH
jgi:hypothetical protein